MPLSINTNIASLTAQRAMLNSNSALETSYERLSTGQRINSASDDAAGLAIGKDLESRVSGLNQAIRNVNDGISMVQIAEGSLDEATSILQRMRDLAVQGSNGSLSSTEQGYLDTEQEKLATALDDVLKQAKFDDITLIDSTATDADDKDSTVTLQIGADSGETLGVVFQGLSAASLGVAAADITMDGTSTSAETAAVSSFAVGDTGTVGDTYTLTVGDQSFTTAAAAATDDYDSIAKVAAALNTAISAAGGDFTLDTSANITFTNKGNQTTNDGDYSITGTLGNASAYAVGTYAQTDGVADASGAIAMIDKALALVADDRAQLGATQGQLESTVRNLANVAENTSAAAGRIMDTDYAAETANLTKAQILQQAATSVLAQANAQPQAVLSLLQ
ncbi:flagellin [Luminiphilus sp.]|nr:flagellin [Luminiphilus sp.]